MIRDLGLAFAAFVAGTLLAELLGATNLGTALTFGTVAFMLVVVGRIVGRGPRRTPAPDEKAPPAARKPPPPPPRRRRRR